MNTITLPDGYNSHTVECDAAPIAKDGDLLELRVTGSSHLIRWVRRSEWEALTAKYSNELATEDGIILIQSCDTHTANVGISKGDRTCYRRVYVPSLAQAEESRFIPWEMRDEEFAAILGKHAPTVVEMIDRLNTNGEPNR